MRYEGVKEDRVSVCVSLYIIRDTDCVRKGEGMLMCNCFHALKLDSTLTLRPSRSSDLQCRKVSIKFYTLSYTQYFYSILQIT